VLDAQGLQRVFYADNLWGIAAGIWIATGLARAFAGLEKGSAYYLHNRAFWVKMTLFGLILLLEVSPMATLIRWRSRYARGEEVDTRRAGVFAGISVAQAGLVMAMVFAATAMARGLGY
jgi:putative membrane protein